MFYQSRLYAGIAVILVTAGFIPSVPQAQVLEEIIVTAQRREQSLQEVPISIQTFTGAEVIKQGYRDLDALADMTPGLMVLPQQNETVVAIRGFGTSSDTLTVEMATSMFLDGVHMSRMAQGKTAFLDVDRIEVLKGPQPIAFGQNAVAGAISVTSRKPTPEWEGYVNTEAGVNNTFEGGFGVGGPVSDTLGIRLAGKYETTAGYLEDFITGDKYPHQNDAGGRIILRWTPSDKIEITTKADKSRIRAGSQGNLVCLTGKSLIWAMDGPPNTNSTSATPSGPNGLYADPPIGIGWAQQFTPLPRTDDNCFDSNISISNEGPLYDVPSNIHLERNNVGAIDVRRAAQGWMDDPKDPYARGIFNNILGYEELDSENYYADMTYAMDSGIELRSFLTFSKFNRETQEHNFNTPFYENHQIRNEDYDQWSGEIRAISPSDGYDFGIFNMEWMLSLSIQQSTYDIVTGNLRANLRTGLRMNQLDEDTTYKNAIANLTFNFLDNKASIDLGGRMTWVNKDSGARGEARQWIFNVRPTSALANANLITICFPCGATNTSAHSIYLPYNPANGLYYYRWNGSNASTGVPVEWRGTANAIAVGLSAPEFGVREGPYYDLIDDLEYDPAIALRYRLTANHSLFFRYAEAFKAGGFDTGQTTFASTPAGFDFEKESARTFEAGSKGMLWDGRARYDIVFFKTIFSDLQLESSTPFLDDPYASINAGERVSQGVEISTDFAVTDQLGIGVSGAILDSVMTDFPGAGCTVFEFQNAATGPCISTAESIAMGKGTLLQGTIDRTGADGPYAPFWSIVLNLDYWMPVFDTYKATFSAKGYLSDEYFTNSRNFSKVTTYHQHGDLNLNLGFGDSADVWEFSFWVRNIFEPHPTYNPAEDPLNDGTLAVSATPGFFRTYGVKFLYNF